MYREQRTSIHTPLLPQRDHSQYMSPFHIQDSIDAFWYKRIKTCGDQVSKLSVVMVLLLVLVGIVIFFSVQIVNALRLKVRDVTTKLDNFQRIVGGISADIRRLEVRFREVSEDRNARQPEGGQSARSPRTALVPTRHPRDPQEVSRDEIMPPLAFVHDVDDA